MNRWRLRARAGVVCISLAAAMQGATPAAAQTGTRLQISGRSTPVDVKMIGGKPYGSLNDVARALGLTLVKKPNGYLMVAAGGANEVAGKARGKIGDELFTGDWRFKVSGVTVADQYTPRYSADHAVIRPKSATDTLVIVTCRIKNGHSARELLNFQNMYGTGDRTALTDNQQHSYALTRYDVHHDYYNYGAYVLPGAAIDFALVFDVPRGTTPAALVYTIYRYDDRGDPKKHTDVRVALTP